MARLLIIDKSGLSKEQLLDLKLINREYHPTIITVVDAEGDSIKYKIPAILAKSFALKIDPRKIIYK